MGLDFLINNDILLDAIKAIDNVIIDCTHFSKGKREKFSSRPNEHEASLWLFWKGASRSVYKFGGHFKENNQFTSFDSHFEENDKDISNCLDESTTMGRVW